MGNGSRHFKPNVTFSGLQISNNQQQLAGWSFMICPQHYVYLLWKTRDVGERWQRLQQEPGLWTRSCGEAAGHSQCGGGGRGGGHCVSHLFGNLGPYLCITRYVDEQGISYWKLSPGLNILSHSLRVCYSLPSLEKLKTKTVHGWRWLLLMREYAVFL